MTNPDDQSSTGRTDDDALDRAAAEGPLPSIGATDRDERSGDNSATDDPDRAAERAGEGDVVGGIDARPE